MVLKNKFHFLNPKYVALLISFIKYEPDMQDSSDTKYAPVSNSKKVLYL